MRTFELLLSFGCNAKCGFCYNPPLTPDVLAQEITFRQAAELLAKARADGYEGVWFTGGDPSLRPDLAKLLMLSRKLGFRRIQIGTNAVRLAQERFTRRLVSAGLNYARISLHSATAPIHDGIMGIPGAFDCALRAIRLLQNLGVYVGLNFVVNKLNYKELPAFFKLSVNTLNIRDFDVIFPHYRGMMEINGDSLGVRYSKALPYLRRSFSLYDRLGLRKDTPTLVNIPPCIAPELKPWIADWSAGEGSDSLVVPGARIVDIHEMKGSQRAKAPPCRTCILDAVCLGFEREYVQRYGTDEFIPVQAAPITSG